MPRPTSENLSERRALGARNQVPTCIVTAARRSGRHIALNRYERGPEWLQSDWILERCGRNAKERRRWYREYCEAAVRGGLKNPVPENVLEQLCLGGREFLKEVLRKSGRSPAGPRPGFEQIRVAIEKVRQETWDTMVIRHGDWSRDLELYLMRENGHSLRVAAKAVGIKRAPTAGMAIQRFEARLATDKTLRKAVEQVKKKSQVNQL